MNRRPPYPLFLLLGLILSGNLPADQSNRYRSMAESMFDMMDAFSSAYQKRTNKRDRDWIRREAHQSSWLGGAPSWGYGQSPWNMIGSPLSSWSSGIPNYWPGPWNPSVQGFAPQYNWRPAWSRPGPLDGDWEDPAGNLLSVANGRFRISQSRDRYTEGYLRLETGKILSMRIRNSDYKRYYEYATQEEKLVLRDSAGNLLLFRRTDY